MNRIEIHRGNVTGGWGVTEMSGHPKIAIDYDVYREDEPFWRHFIIESRKAGHQVECDGVTDDDAENKRRMAFLPEGTPLTKRHESGGIHIH